MEVSYHLVNFSLLTVPGSQKTRLIFPQSVFFQVHFDTVVCAVVISLVHVQRPISSTLRVCLSGYSCKLVSLSPIHPKQIRIILLLIMQFFHVSIL